MIKKACDIMLDLETMGTGPNAAIVAIGAVVFDTDILAVTSRFYRIVDLESAMSTGGEVDADTVLWWMQQSDEARSMFDSSNDGVPLFIALTDFSTWVKEHGDPSTVRVWGNGAAFDNVILSSAYRRIAGLDQPWKHWNDRCYRTIKSLHPDVKLKRVGTHHNAVDDAESQAWHLLTIFEKETNQ